MTNNDFLKGNDILYKVKTEKGLDRTAYLWITPDDCLSLDVSDGSDITRNMFGGDYEFSFKIKPKDIPLLLQVLELEHFKDNDPNAKSEFYDTHLLTVEDPPRKCRTELEKAQLLIFTFYSHPEGDIAFHKLLDKHSVPYEFFTWFDMDD